MPEVFIYNGTNKTLDLTTTFYDVITQRAPLVPPGSQGHITVDQQGDLDAVLAQLSRYGATPHAQVQNPQTFAGVSHSVTQVVAGTKAPPVVELKPPAKPPVAPPKK